ncbi:hypothetical protein BL250_07605 [Erwinia sp. OLTSP20]|uniref:DUF5993 family protein n=1 Tax=unclassified Erwinia TaxID=2622719 RepID=UPI000C197890|nr:hypothetical protein BV501_07875 [Erwinia sp. OAMSP11]PIJ72709.1 hypothetical protein BK416_08735 [Erwinia sp. OLSSP12]PIJ83208.1 hypothetical protein BLD47_05020 [Erwinia sp. OLCASP19]PIJ85290.1 hypothetical protein BLD46_06705 [Erwinia sp. OLMTSP26]PIJ87292.1 hypothetical protein BLD49_06720 [Erwinia sp. OLMDSP33]PIJ90100.1 hypothetical protein BL249_13680 [Erwinia sp. OLFS4]PIJ92970.1 hypothetical protein BL250_07605 [Erwinia sp. OLTSP20]
MQLVPEMQKANAKADPVNCRGLWKSVFSFLFTKWRLSMFMPFLIALCTAFCAVAGKKKLSYSLWVALMIVTMCWFKYHASSALTLSF